ncbi:MAG: hypothetical protein WAV56_05285, partial [Microgenomates group bacterium]
MKLKLFLSLLLFVSLFFLKSSPALATCAAPNDWTGVCERAVQCGGSIGGTSGTCCDTAAECGTLDTSTLPTSSHDTTGTGTQLPENQEAADKSAYCEGGKGINTALGCISFDAEGGGFVKSL